MIEMATKEGAAAEAAQGEMAAKEEMAADATEAARQQRKRWSQKQ